MKLVGDEQVLGPIEPWPSLNSEDILSGDIRGGGTQRLIGPMAKSGPYQS